MLKMISALPIFLVLQLLLLCLAYTQWIVTAPRQFYIRTPDFTHTPIDVLDRPNFSTKTLLNWATLAATSSFTLDFVNVEKQLESLRDYFTNDGYTEFVSSLTNNNTLGTIQDKKLVGTAVATGPAVLLSEEQLGSAPAWRIQVPVLIRYQSANVNTTQQQVVEMLVVQVPTQDAPKGIGIAQYIAWNADSEI